MIPSSMYAEWLRFSACLAVGTILVTGSVGKLIYFKDFSKVLAAYQILPKALVLPCSLILVVSEGATGLAIFVRKCSPTAGMIAGGLFSLFAVAITINLARGRRELPCGCFGKGAKAISWRLVMRNIALMATALLAAGLDATFPLILLVSYGLTIVLQSVTNREGSIANSTPV